MPVAASSDLSGRHRGIESGSSIVPLLVPSHPFPEHLSDPRIRPDRLVLVWDVGGLQSRRTMQPGDQVAWTQACDGRLDARLAM
jgi:hypothetical protein